MNKSIVLVMALVALLMLSCTKIDKTVVDNGSSKSQQTLETQDPTSDANQFVDSQFVDPDQEVEIGSII